MRILIIKMSSLGDVIHALPVARGIKRAIPNARIDWLVEEGASELLCCVPDVDKALVWPRRQWTGKLLRPSDWGDVMTQLRRFLGVLRMVPYDIALDLQGLFKSGIWLLATRSRKKAAWHGTSESGFHWFARRIRIPQGELHAVDRNMKVAQQLLPITKEVEFAFKIDEEAIQWAQITLRRQGWQNGRPYVVMIPGARWETKLWFAERFAQVADHLHKHWGLGVVLVGSPKDRPISSRIASCATVPSIDLTGKTNLIQLMALMKGAEAAVSVDSGPMHLAAALGIPVVAIFGPTAPWQTGPYGRGHRVTRSEIPCSPCYRTHCPQRSCMSMVYPEHVCSAIADVMGSAGDPLDTRAQGSDGKKGDG